MNMTQAKQITRSAQYASSADFQQIFDEDMSALYQLSFLLTADHEKAEQCFVSGLEDAIEGNPVFKEWARSWARRAIIQNAVRAIHPRPTGRSNDIRPGSVKSNGKTRPAEHLELQAVLELEPFERFVYVMTVLERYSDHECSVLLGCALRDVLASRIRALQQLGSTAGEHSHEVANTRSQDPMLREHGSSILEPLAAHV
jgi:DNA-directed RNA polymerase specialized sigma24 family protein